MGIADSVLSAIPGIRRWWWRRKWTSLDVPAEEWAALDEMAEDLHDALGNVRSLEQLIMNASTMSAAHGMNTRTVYRDPKGKEHAVDIVLDGAGATEKLMEGYHREMDARRREMMDIAAAMSRWSAKNAVIREYPDRAPLHTRLAGFVRNVRRMSGELSKAREGRTADEFLRYALLDREAREKRLAIEKPPERVKLEKPEPVPEPSKPKKKSGDAARKIAALLPQTFREQGVDVRFVSFKAAHAVTRYRLKLDEGQKLSKAENISGEVAMRLGVDRVAISKAPDEAQIIYVDVPNRDVKPLLYKDAPREPGKFFVGESIEGEPVFTDMESLCHVLIAGMTGSGKSTFLNTVICSMIQEPPSENQFLMIDPKMVELTPYNGIPHLERPVVTDPEEAVGALEEAVREMNERYRFFMEMGVKKLSDYNEKAFAPLPRLIVVVDELADLMIASGKEVESSIIRIAQKGRAAGVHLIIATQRPTADVVTGLIKANIPSRIAFAVTSAMESRIILDSAGAEKLTGNGDMLYAPQNANRKRVQGCYISPEEVEKVTSFVKKSG